MNPILFHTLNWNEIAPCVTAGETGTAEARTKKFDGLRVRIVEYSKNYRADHWCKAGHVVYCLEGEMISELSDGRSFKISKGMSYIVTDDVSMHRSYSEHGVKLMIIDGDFLKRAQTLTLNPWRM